MILKERGRFSNRNVDVQSKIQNKRRILSGGNV